MENPNYSKQTAKFIATLIQSMPAISSDGMQFWIENSGLLGKVIRNEFDVDHDQEPLYTVTVGAYTSEELLTQLRQSGSVNAEPVDWAHSKISVSSEKQEVDLVCIQPTNCNLLGLSDTLVAKYYSALGYKCVTPEIAILLGLALCKEKDPEAPAKLVAMRFPQGNGDIGISYVYTRDGSGEYKRNIHKIDRFNNDPLVLVRPRK